MVSMLFGARADFHFWLATIGIVLYITSLWVAGIGQGLMLRSFDDYGNLAYTFIETVEFMHTPYVWRALGGAFFVAGILVMVWNVAMTVWLGRHVREASDNATPALAKA